MRWEEVQHEPCSIARTLSIVGERWTLLVLRNCFLGERRFEGLQKQLGVTRHLLSERLKALVEHGILQKHPYQQKPTRYEYRLTEKGIDLYPVLVSLTLWGNKWLGTEEGPPVQYIHRTCGEMITPTLNCPVCGEEIHARAMQPVFGPGLQSALEDPAFCERWASLLPRLQAPCRMP